MRHRVLCQHPRRPGCPRPCNRIAAVGDSLDRLDAQRLLGGAGGLRQQSKIAAGVRHLERRDQLHLVAIIDAGSLSRAAALVHVAQPALSLQVAALEAELGTKLLERSPAGVVPTPAGKVAVSAAAMVF